MVRLMQRSKRYQAFEHRHDRFVDEHRLRVGRPAVDDAMADAVEPDIAGMGREPVMDRRDRAGMIGA